MKIGFSFGRCVRDIVNGEVAIEDVLVIIARTWMPTVEDALDVIEQYMYERTYLRGLDEEECKRVGKELFESGRIHQPRALTKGGVYQTRIQEDYVWMDVVPTTVSDIPAVQEAWENYQLVLRLCNTLPDAAEAPRN
jgi:hypothetical protein